MLNKVYQLTSSKNVSIKYKVSSCSNEDSVVVKPTYMAICHADQRYYQGQRDSKILAKKLPMALIHEAVGVIVSDPTGTYKLGQKVVMIPNQPPRPSDDTFYENYMSETYFLSSGYDGFMQESVTLPLDRVVAYDDIDDKIAVLSEFTSVAMHAIARFDVVAHYIKDNVAIVGDGSLAYVVATALHYVYPDMKITVIGRNPSKLRLFNFVHETYLASNLPEESRFDHAFECAGGQGSEPAINEIIRFIKPQGTILLMGVSENRVAINTRDVLEKGLTLVGSSRSGRIDFEKTVAMMSNSTIQKRLKHIVDDFGEVNNVDDIHDVFAKDLTTAFKTIFKWNL